MTSMTASDHTRAFFKAIRRTAGLCIAALAVVVAAMIPTAAKAEYPDKPITLIIPNSAGGGTDTQARAMASLAEASLGQPFQAVNKTGASGFIAAKYVADANADGYNVMVQNAGTMILAALDKPQVVDPFNDFEIVAMFGELYTALTVRKDDTRFKDLKSFIAYAKQHPEMTYGFTGKGSFHHLAALGVEDSSGFTARAVPFKGGSEVRAALLGGQVDFAWMGVQQLTGFEDQLTAYGLAAETRDKMMPDYPTFKEQGVPYTLVTGPTVVMVKTGTPAPIVAKLQAAIKSAVTSDKYANIVEKKGLGPVYRDGNDATAYLKDLAEKWKPLVAKAGN